MNEVLNRVVWNNTLLSYLFAFCGILFAWLILKLMKRRLIIFLKKITSRTNTRFDDLLVEASEKFILPYLYLAINYNIILQLNISAGVINILHVAAMLATTYFVVRMVDYTIQHIVVMSMKAKKEPDERIGQVQGMLMVVKVIVWVSGIVMLADNLGYNVTTIIAGFGVGGIAIALAAQSILGDLFSYIVIFFDKPFEIGDFIITGNFSGVVEKIGIKTSHVRSLDGQQLIMPNTEMVKSVIQNFKRLEKRRVVFTIGVVYNTSSGKLRGIPEMIKKIITTDPNAAFDRAHLKSFGDFSINYEIVYYIASSDYVVYMNTQEAICLKIFEQFEKEGIEFAFPTQTIFLNKSDSGQNNQSEIGAFNRATEKHN